MPVTTSGKTGTPRKPDRKSEPAKVRLKEPRVRIDNLLGDYSEQTGAHFG